MQVDPGDQIDKQYIYAATQFPPNLRFAIIKKQDQIGLERSANRSCSMFCVLCTVGEVNCVSLESEYGKELA